MKEHANRDEACYVLHRELLNIFRLFLHFTWTDKTRLLAITSSLTLYFTNKLCFLYIYFFDSRTHVTPFKL